MEYIVSYRIVSREKPSYRIDIVSSRKKLIAPGWTWQMSNCQREGLRKQEELPGSVRTHGHQWYKMRFDF